MKTRDETIITYPKNELAEKVEKGGPDAMTPERLERLERMFVANHRAHYMDMLNNDLDELEMLYIEVRIGGEGQDEATARIRDIAHEVRGMAGTFGFELISIIADHLYLIVDEMPAEEPLLSVAVRLHIDAMRVAVTEDISGNGGERGQEVMAGLKEIRLRMAKSHDRRGS